MSKIYGFNVSVYHYVEVEADSVEEAEELAYDQFSDDAGWWDSTDVDLVYTGEEL